MQTYNHISWCICGNALLNGEMKLTQSPSSLLQMLVSPPSKRVVSYTSRPRLLSWRSKRLLMRSLRYIRKLLGFGVTLVTSSSPATNPPQPSLWQKRRKPTLPLTKPKSWRTSLLSLPSFSSYKNNLQRT
jgi:hypothetical protein